MTPRTFDPKWATRPDAVFVFAVIAVHCALLWLPSVNFEWAFADAALYFEQHQPDLIARYFSVEANPTIFSFIASLFHRPLWWVNVSTVTRLVSISGIAPLAWALLRLNALTGIAARAVVARRDVSEPATLDILRPRNS
jgi:hypothetical protein